MDSKKPTSDVPAECSSPADARRARRVHLALASAVVIPVATLLALAGCSGGLSANKANLTSALQQPEAQSSGDPLGPIIGGYLCPKVMVIAARGSAEAPQSPYDWTDPADYVAVGAKAGFGAGPELYNLYKQLTDAHTGLSISLDPVMYPANPVPTNPVGYLAQYEEYRASVRSGASTILSDMQLINSFCSDVPFKVSYVIAGYSQGAWVVHDALHQMTPRERSEISGVVLFGDSDFVPLDSYVKDYKYLDMNLGVSAAIDFSNTGVPSAVASRTGSWCFPNDPICQVLPSTAIWAAELYGLAHNRSAHLDYVSAGATTEAVKFLKPLLPRPLSLGFQRSGW